MEGLLFYWFAWASWIIFTFLLPKHPQRTTLSIWILSMIIISPYNMEAGGIHFHASAFVIMFFIYLHTKDISKKTFTYLFITSLILMLGYVSFLIFELFDPVWLLFDRTWMAAVMIAYLTLLLQTDKKMRIVTMLVGTLQGEILYSLILKKLGMPYLIASMEFLDVIAISSFVLLAWSGLELLSAYIENNLNYTEGEKHNHHE
ncbi:YphA family membrane protein [Mesobacillus harenae]|uniref:YphA family membrane protein n=1 Tax=Mesobacillus harenae TaxID=2213203 RepID=UPI00157FBF49|nr:hypothetical protein [Mesobacillus harenae]